MESEKVKEIKKGLKDHSIEKLKYQDGIKIKEIDFTDILTLINELESENEIIKFNMKETEKASFNINQMNGNLVFENQILKDRIAELENENKDYYDRLNNLQTYIDNHEEIWKGNTNNALKQFAERLKEKAHKGASRNPITYKFIERDYTITESELNELLKEYEK